MGLISQELVYYLLCGVIFNFIYDSLINFLGKEFEKLRFSLLERIIVGLFWPIALIRMIIGFISTFIKW